MPIYEVYLKKCRYDSKQTDLTRFKMKKKNYILVVLFSGDRFSGNQTWAKSGWAKTELLKHYIRAWFRRLQICSFYSTNLALHFLGFTIFFSGFKLRFVSEFPEFFSRFYRDLFPDCFQVTFQIQIEIWGL